MISRRVLVLFVVALVVRAVMVPFLPADFPLGSDPNSYQALADNLRAMRGLQAGGQWAVFPPLYPMMLAVFPVWLLNPALDLAVAATILLLGKALKRDAYWSAAIYLFWPPAILTTLTPQKDTLAILLVAQVALWAIRLRQRDGSGVRLGLSGGLLALAQPAFAPFAPLLFLFLCWGRWRRALVVSYAMLVILAPWWIRNWLIFGSLVPLTSATGHSLLVAATGHYDGVRQFAPLGEIEGSRAAGRAALDIWREQPLAVGFRRAAAAAKAVLLERWFYDMAHWLPAYHPLREAVFWPAMVYWWGALIVAGVRVRHAPKTLWIIIAACCTQLAIFNFWFEFGERHRYLLVPFVFLAAGLSRTTLGGIARTSRPR